MIDTKELRRLTQAATSGDWYVERGNHIYGRNNVTDGEEEWRPVIACTDDDEVNVNFEANASFIAAANPATISEILDRLEAAEEDRSNFLVEIGKLCAQCDALCLRIKAAEKERDECNRRRLEAADHFAAQTALMKKKYDALRAKIAEMEQQEPVAWRTFDGEGGYDYRSYEDNENYKLGWDARNPNHIGWVEPLYTLHGAQAQPTPSEPSDEYVGWYCAHCERGVDASEVTYHEQHQACGRVITDDRPPRASASAPEGWKLVPTEPTEKMINEGTCASTLPGPRYIDSACAKQCWANMLAAAPEAKPSAPNAVTSEPAADTTEPAADTTEPEFKP